MKIYFRTPCSRNSKINSIFEENIFSHTPYCSTISHRLVTLQRGSVSFLQTSPDGNRRVIDRRREFYFSQLRYAAKARFDQIFIPPTTVPLESRSGSLSSLSLWLTRGDALPKREGSQTISSIPTLSLLLIPVLLDAPFVARSRIRRRAVHTFPWRKGKTDDDFSRKNA